MCQHLILSLTMAMNPLLSERLAALDLGPDKFGRYLTTNAHGYVDPQDNPYAQQFLEWGMKHAAVTPQGHTSPENKLRILLEIGGGYGFVAEKAAALDVAYGFNDMCQEHVDIAENAFSSQYYDLFTCRFPNADFSAADHLNYVQMRTFLRQNRRVVGMAAFSVLHFLTAKQIEEFLQAAYETLEPGGRLFLTMATPYNMTLSLFPWIFERRKEKFLADPLNHRFPGEIDNANSYFNPRLRKQTERPANKYPDFFHAMDPEVFSYLVNSNPARPFEIVQAEFYQRPNPPNQAVPLRYARGQGEMMGVILQKAGTLPPLPKEEK